MQRTVKMSKATIAIITRENDEVKTTLATETFPPMGKREMSAKVKEKYGDMAVILSVTDEEVMTYMSLATWLAHCTTEPTKD